MRLIHCTLALPLLAAAAAPNAIQPGRWQTTITVTDVKMAGAPPGMVAAMRAHPTTVSSCVTPAQAAGGPRAALNQANGRCRYTSYTIANGRLESTAVCTRPDGTLTVHSAGSFTPTAITLDGTSTATGRMPMTLTTRIVGRRVGGC